MENGIMPCGKGNILMDIVCFGQQNWDICWTGKQQFMSRLARRGHRVLYVDPAPSNKRKSPIEAIRSFAPLTTRLGLRQEQPNLWVFTYHAFPFSRTAIRERHYHSTVKALVRKMCLYRPIGICMIPHQKDLVKQLPLFASIYYAVDEWTGFGGLPEEVRRSLREKEDYLIEHSDMSLAVSPRLYERFRKRNPRTFLLPNGVDTQHFDIDSISTKDIPPELNGIPRPRIGYVGLIDERLDYDMLINVADTQPDRQFVFIGRTKDRMGHYPGFIAFTSRPNVHLLGFRRYEELPRYIAGFDMCIAPYVFSELTQSCNPLKVYEYLATGLPTAATPVEGIAEDVMDAIACPVGIEEWNKAIRHAPLSPETGREKRLAAAAGNSWDARVDQLEDFLEEAVLLGLSDPSRDKGRWWSSGRAIRRALRFWDGMPPLDEKERTALGIRAAGLNHPPGTRTTRGDHNRKTNPSLFNVTRGLGWILYLVRISVRLFDGKRPKLVRKILVSRLGYLGDAILFVPTLRALRARYPEAHITVVTGNKSPLVKVVSELTGCIDDSIMLHEERMGTKDKLVQAYRLLCGGYDMLVMGSTIAVAPPALYCGAPRRIGLYDGYPIGRKYNRVHLLDPNRHEVDNHLALIEGLGMQDTLTERIPKLTLSATGPDDAWDNVRGGFPALSSRSFVVVHPGSKRPSRRWSTERLAELVDRFLTSRGDLDVVITGSEGERYMGERLHELVSESNRERVHVTCGRTSVPGLFTLVEHAEAVVSNDTGTVHLARALERPLLALLGPENDRRWGPYPLGGPRGISLRYVVPCAPCERWSCPDHFCMKLLSVDRAFRALTELLGSQTGFADTETPEVSAALPDIAGLERRRMHRSWKELADHGFNTPTVSVMALLTKDSMEVAKVKLERLSAAAASSRYPGIETVVSVRATDFASLAPNAIRNGIHLKPVEGNEDELTVALHNCSSDLVRIWNTESLDDLDDHIAMIYRSALVMGAWGRQVADLPMIADRIPRGLSGSTVHRRALELLVVKKLPLSSALELVPLFTDKASERMDLLEKTQLVTDYPAFPA